MKHLLILVAIAVAMFWPSLITPTSAQLGTRQALRTCFGNPLFVSIGDSLIYCDQAGTIFQDANDLNTRGLFRVQMLSQNF